MNEDEGKGGDPAMQWTIKANVVYQIRQWPLVERCMTPGEEDTTARTVQTSLTHLQTKRKRREQQEEGSKDERGTGNS